MILPVNSRISMLFISLLLLTSHDLKASNLKQHPSPYLSMHANDPVQWQLWGQDVLEKARQNNRLVYVSIGYFSCHWCHVMQKESYADAEVGAFLNSHFEAVKVDRELRPELDRRLVRFVEAVRGQAGWPLNVFITPDGYPVTGFTYLPRDQFLQVLKQLDKEWKQRHEEIREVAKAYFEQTETDESKATLVTLPQQHRGKVLDAFVSQAMLMADDMQGGFGDTMKFPSYPQLNALLKTIQLNPDIDPEVIRFVRLTLDNMASRHLMDHVNDGFFRYTTDPDWQTPHFEKMLYDNAQLATLYFDAEKLWPEQGYGELGLRTVNFMLRELRDESGGFNASLSAVDTDQVEGAAYYWTVEQLKAALDDEQWSLVQQQWQLSADTPQPLQIRPLIGQGATAEAREKWLQIRDRLRHAPRPVMPVDNKKLASWNALTLKALLRATQYRDDKRLREATDALFRFIQQQFIKSTDQQFRVVRFAGQSEVAETTLEDYAQLAHALQWYALDRDHPQAASLAVKLVEQAYATFSRGQYWIQDTESLIPGDPGELIIQDAVLESPVTLLLESVFLMPNAPPALLQQSRQLASRLTRDVLDIPYHYGSTIVLAQRYQAP